MGELDSALKIFELVKDLTFSGLLIFFIYGGLKEKPWWVFGWTYRATLEEKKEFKEMAFRLMNPLERTLAAPKDGRG